MSGGVCLITRFFNNFTRDGSDSSLELEGVCGGEGGKRAASMTDTCRTTATDMVASAAISRARADDRGVVVNTTK